MHARVYMHVLNVRVYVCVCAYVNVCIRVCKCTCVCVCVSDMCVLTQYKDNYFCFVRIEGAANGLSELVYDYACVYVCMYVWVRERWVGPYILLLISKENVWEHVSLLCSFGTRHSITWTRMHHQ